VCSRVGQGVLEGVALCDEEAGHLNKQVLTRRERR